MTVSVTSAFHPLRTLELVFHSEESADPPSIEYKNEDSCRNWSENHYGTHDLLPNRGFWATTWLELASGITQRGWETEQSEQEQRPKDQRPERESDIEDVPEGLHRAARLYSIGDRVNVRYPPIADISMMADQAAMDEEPLGRAWKIGCAAVALGIAAFAAWLVITMFNVSHDKSLNSRMQNLWFDPKGAPLGIVVAANNRWMDNAFIADVSREDGKKIAVLVLDDHYMSGDGSLRSESGVIGDPISRAVLCSVPAQAKKTKVELDPVVVKLIKSQC